MRETAILKTADLKKTFPTVTGPLEILKGINLVLSPGEMVAVVGQSGSGKSTLLHILGALDRPSSGTVYFGEDNIFAFSNEELAKFRRHAIGFVFQFHNLLPEFTALENVLMPKVIAGELANAGLGKELLDRVGLSDRLEHRPGQLSGGEQQRVAIARALINRPRLILADEPTGSLDSRAGELVFELFQEIQREKKLTSLLATHNVKIATRCDRILRIENGILLETDKNHV
jgi:lipoprotein-releasing system ATP-binding protein